MNREREWTNKSTESRTAKKTREGRREGNEKIFEYSENLFIFFVQQLLLISISVGKEFEAVILKWYLIKIQFYFNNVANTSQFHM